MLFRSLVPASRLLWLVGLVVIPAATAAGAAPGWGGLAWLVVLGVVLIASADAILGWSRLASIVVDAPPVRHGAPGREVDVAMAVSGLVTATRAGLSLPDLVRCARPVVTLEAPASTAQWHLLALRRGRHRFESIHLEAPTPLGLWYRRRAVPLATELQIHPDLRRARAGVDAVFLNRDGVGAHARSRSGKGREFDHLREYASGDDFGDIHWKTTARRGYPVTKIFQIERTREVYAVIDHSRLSARLLRSPADSLPEAGPDEPATGGSEGITTCLEKSLECALALGLAAERQHDRFGLVTFADQVTHVVRAGAGRGHFGVCRNTLATLEPQLVAPGFEELFVFLRRSLTRRSLVVILTDLSDPLQAEAFAKDVPLIARHHLVLVSMIRPEQATPLFARASVKGLDDIYHHLGGHWLWHDLQEVAVVLARCGVRLVLPDSAALIVQTVSRYLEIKNRQVL